MKIEDEIEAIIDNILKMKTARIGLNNTQVNAIINGKKKTFPVKTIFFTVNAGIKQTVIGLSQQDIENFVVEMTLFVNATTSECLPCKGK